MPKSYKIIVKQKLAKVNLANKCRLVSAAAAQIDLAASFTFVEKLPTVPENSTQEPGGEIGNDRHKGLIEFILVLPQ